MWSFTSLLRSIKGFARLCFIAHIIVCVKLRMVALNGGRAAGRMAAEGGKSGRECHCDVGMLRVNSTTREQFNTGLKPLNCH